MLPVDALKNAVLDDHLVDYLTLVRLHGTPAAEVTRLQEYQRARSAAHRESVASALAGNHSCHFLQDSANLVSVCVDYVMTGQAIESASPAQFSLEHDAQYPVVVRHVAVRYAANGRTLLNTPVSRFIKVQLACACNALGARKGFLVGKNGAWAEVDMLGADKSVAQTAQTAAAWAHHVTATAHQMSIDPPSDRRLYPNMCVTSQDPRAQALKKELALQNHELTLIRGIGVKHRNAALDAGMRSYEDPRVCAEVLNIRGAAATVVDTILRANQPLAGAQTTRTMSVMSGCMRGDVFIDIETLSFMSDDVPDMVFMVGLGYGTDTFECVRAPAPTLDGERSVLDRMLAVLRKVRARRLIHWGAYEVCIFQKVQQRHGLDFMGEYEWVDMCKMVERSGFCPRNAFSFSLKSIVPAMYGLGMIGVVWDSSCTDGMEAMVGAYYAYMSNDAATLERILNDIERYNLVDVVSTMQIWRYLYSRRIRI